ncbi:MAG: hypothetical protein V3U65_20035 [Granulosicoccaceae bacterium]
MVTHTYKRGLAALLLLTLLQGCSTTPNARQGAVARNGVAVLGVVTQSGVNGTMSEASLNGMMHDIVRETGRFSSLAAHKVSKVVGGDRYTAIMESYAETGSLQPEDIQLLMAARLPVNYAIISRIQENATEAGPSTVESLRNNAGELLNDRERVVHSTLRRVTLTSTMIDLRTGAAYWSRSYKAEPVNKASYTRYSGSSFAGSLAATMTNTVANGIRKPSGPPAPSLQLTLQSLMREVARTMRPG